MNLHLISGLPRSGSTLLCNILAQNPEFAVTATSGILEIVFMTRNRWQSVAEFRAMDDDERMQRLQSTQAGILNGYFASENGCTIFDKSRGWLSHLEMAEFVLGKKPKALVCVRDVRDILASFEKLYRQHSGAHQPWPETEDYIQAQSTQGRCMWLMREDRTVGLAYTRVKDALQRGWGDQMHFVEYEALTGDPAGTMKAVYKFLEEKPFTHDFDNVEQVTVENDYIWNLPDLHKIRGEVEPQPPSWPAVLGQEIAQNWDNLKVW